MGSVGSGAARQQQQQEGQQQQQPGEPGAGWLRDTRTAPSDRTRPHSAPVPITTTMVKTFQVRQVEHLCYWVSSVLWKIYISEILSDKLWWIVTSLRYQGIGVVYTDCGSSTGVPPLVPPDVLVHTLPSTPGQPWRTDIQGEVCPRLHLSCSFFSRKTFHHLSFFIYVYSYYSFLFFYIPNTNMVFISHISCLSCSLLINYPDVHYPSWLTEFWFP